MFVRVKRVGPYRYLQIVANHREGRRTVQRVLATLGRVDQLGGAGAVDVLLRSLGRFAKQVRVLEGHDRPQLEAGVIRQVGPDLVFGRLWQTLGLQSALIDLLHEHRLELVLERAVYRTVLDHLWEAGSDRAADRWRGTVDTPRAAGIELHDLDRAMRWLGQTRQEVEKALFLARRDLTERSLAFFATTTLFVRGRGGGRLGRSGHLVVGAMLTGDGRPICCEFWSGDDAGDQVLLPAADRLAERFGIGQVCRVADGQTIGARTIEELEQRRQQYIVGVQKAAGDAPAVLRTNTTLPMAGVAAQYERLLLVEQFFRTAASVLGSRPIAHEWDAVVAGHVFCSFLALVLADELGRSLAAHGWQFEWTDMRRDIEALSEVEVRDGDQGYCLRTPLRGVAGEMLKAVGAAVPPPVRPVFKGVPSLEAIGNLPVVFHAQIFGAQERGWLDELGVNRIELLRFPAGTSILQAVATGQVDIAYVGVGPLLIAGHQGLPVKAVAATSKDTMAFVVGEAFAAIYSAHKPAAAAFAAFAKQSGRKLRIGTVPRGTTPDLFLRMWLTSIGVDPQRDVEIVPMGVDQLVAAALAGQVDGIVYGEPQITLVRRADPRFKVLLYGKDLVPGLPGGVIMVHQRLIDQCPALVEKLVEIHLRANRLFNTDKDFFAGAVTHMLGERFLPLDVAREAVRSPATHMVTDLRTLAPMLAVYDEFEVREGMWPTPLTIDDLFEYRFYDAAVQQHPELADEARR